MSRNAVISTVAPRTSIARAGPDAGGGYGRVVDFIRDEVLSGRLKVGDRLLAERDLATALGVSRPVVREALRSLAAMGAVDIRQGHGTVVTQPSLGVLADFLTLALAQQAGAVDDVMEARVAIEVHAIGLACERALPVDLQRLSSAFDEIVRTMDDPVRGGEADFHFHIMIVEAAHCASLTSIYTAISTLLQRSHTERRLKILNVKDIDQYLIDHHRKVLDAIVARDAPAAQEVLREHFRIGADLRRLLPPAARAGRGLRAVAGKSARAARAAPTSRR